MSLKRIIFLQFGLLILLCVNRFVQAQNIEPFDQYQTNIPWTHVTAHLDQLAIALRHHPEMNGYILVYPAEKELIAKIKKHVSKVQSYLVGVRMVEKRRLFVVFGAKTSFATTIILQPQDANLPPPKAL